MADPDLLRWAQHTHRRITYMSYTLSGITTPLRFAPGEGWYYGTSYDWAARLLRILTKTSLEDYMRTNIFDPLGISSSTTFRPDKIPDSTDRLLAYAICDDHGVLKPGSCPVPLFNNTAAKDDPPFEAGGSGLFSTPTDYALLLRGILSSTTPDRKETTINHLLFTPQLNPQQREILTAIATYARASGFAPELPADIRLDHGLGGLVNLDDVPGKRRAGSLMWSGATNGRWWIDPTTGIAGAVFTQVEPHGNRMVVEMFDELERVVYRYLGRDEK